MYPRGDSNPQSPVQETDALSVRPRGLHIKIWFFQIFQFIHSPVCENWTIFVDFQNRFFLTLHGEKSSILCRFFPTTFFMNASFCPQVKSSSPSLFAEFAHFFCGQLEQQTCCSKNGNLMTQTFRTHASLVQAINQSLNFMNFRSFLPFPSLQKSFSDKNCKLPSLHATRLENEPG